MISPISYANSLWVWGLSACHLVAYNNALDSNSIVRGLKMRKMSKCFFFNFSSSFFLNFFFASFNAEPYSNFFFFEKCFNFSLLYLSPLWISFKNAILYVRFTTICIKFQKVTYIAEVLEIGTN